MQEATLARGVLCINGVISAAADTAFGGLLLPYQRIWDDVDAQVQRLGAHGLMARLLYGSGLRLMKCLRLRVKDLGFERRAIVVRDGKGSRTG